MPEARGSTEQESFRRGAEAETENVSIRDGSMLANAANEIPVDGLPLEGRVTRDVRSLEAWYASELEKRLAALTEILNTQLQAQVQEVRAHYESLTATLQQQRALQEERAKAVPAGTDSGRLFREIKKVEEVALKCSLELERMVADDSVNLGLLLQMRNQQLELRAYLRGLKFYTEGPSAEQTE
jgi:hypothetical protein